MLVFPEFTDPSFLKASRFHSNATTSFINGMMAINEEENDLENPFSRVETTPMTKTAKRAKAKVGTERENQEENNDQGCKAYAYYQEEG